MFLHVEFLVQRSPKVLTNEDAFMFDLPTVNDTPSTNFALRWDAMTITLILSVLSFNIVPCIQCTKSFKQISRRLRASVLATLSADLNEMKAKVLSRQRRIDELNRDSCI